MKPIPSYEFAACRLHRAEVPHEDDPYLRDEIFLRVFLCVDEEEWRDDFDDALIHQREVRWKRIMVSEADAAALWPYEHIGY